MSATDLRGEVTARRFRLDVDVREAEMLGVALTLFARWARENGSGDQLPAARALSRRVAEGARWVHRYGGDNMAAARRSGPAYLDWHLRRLDPALDDAAPAVRIAAAEEAKRRYYARVGAIGARRRWSSDDAEGA